MRARFTLLVAAVVIVALVVVLVLALAPEAPTPGRAGRGPTDEPPSRPSGEEAVGERPSEPGPATADAVGTLIVEVVDAVDGSPLEGAEVYGGAESGRRLVTDGAGRARDAFPAGKVSMRASASGHVRSPVRNAEVRDGEETVLRIALARGAVVEGVVVAAGDGSPLPGAEVTLMEGGSLPGRASLSMEPLLGMTRTGPDGRFAFDVAPPDEIVTVTARLSGFEPAKKALEPVAGNDGPAIELRLSPAGAVTGVVVDPEGRPVPGAKVYALPADAPSMLLEDPDLTVTGTGGTWRALRGQSDEHGRFEIRGLTIGGAYLVRAVADGFSASPDVADVRPTGENPIAVAELRLRKPGAIRLRLRGPDGEPVAGALVLRIADGWPDQRRSGDDGNLEIEEVAPGSHEIHVRPDAFLWQTIEVVVRGGETADVEVRLEVGESLSGTVVDDRGQPVPGAKVEASRPFARRHRGLEPSDAKTVADEKGRFRLEGLRPGPHIVQATADALEGYYNGPFDAPGKDVRVEMLRRVRVTVRLVLPPGASAPKDVDVGRSYRHRNEAAWGHGGEGWSRTRIAWSDGLVTLPGIQSGGARIELRVAGYGPVRRDVDAAPGETVDLGEIRLGSGVTLRGRVTDLAGNPVPGARVVAQEGFTDSAPATTGRDGSFAIPDLGAGEIEISVEAEGFLEAGETVDTREVAAPVQIVLRRGGLLRGRVVHPPDRPAAGLTVALVDAASGEEEEWEETDHRGSFTIRLPAGRWRVRIHREGETLALREVTLEEGSEAPLHIVLE